jgi:hypothetical protein
MKFKLALLAGLAIAGTNAFACYTVYDAGNRVIYQGEQAPVDMSRPLHLTLGRSNPGAQMVFDQGSNCPARATDTAVVATARTAAPVNTASMGAGPAGGPAAAAPRQLASNGPLLTDRRTAQSLNLPHTVVSGEIVMVPAQYAALVNRPAVNVIPATAFVGAPAESVNTTAMGAAPARSGVVITEKRDGSRTSVNRY